MEEHLKKESRDFLRLSGLKRKFGAREFRFGECLVSAFYLDGMTIPLMRLRAGFTAVALLTICVDQGRRLELPPPSLSPVFIKVAPPATCADKESPFEQFFAFH